MARDTLTGCATTFSDQTKDELKLVAHPVGITIAYHHKNKHILDISPQNRHSESGRVMMSMLTIGRWR